MEILTSEEIAVRASLSITNHGLVWIEGKNRTTGETESIGLWTGDDVQVFNVGGSDRTYYGAGNIISLPEIESAVGVKARTTKMTFSSLTPEMMVAVKQYDARMARIEIHRVEYDQGGNVVNTNYRRLFKGYISTINDSKGRKGSQAVLTVNLVTSAWSLTKFLTTLFSDASQRLIDDTDDFNRYTDVTDSADVWWGTKQSNTAQTQTSRGRVAGHNLRSM